MTADVWITIAPGVRRLSRPPGPAFQYVDPIGYEWNVIEVAVPGLPPSMVGYRIVHMSDLHCHPRWLMAYDDLSARLAEDPPDLLAVTGDYVEEIEHPGPSLPTVRRLMSNLAARDGVFAVFGNHDEEIVRADLAGTPTRFVDGERVVVGGRIELIGMPGYERADLDPAWLESLPAATAGVPRVVLSHYPDHVRRLRRLRADLLLSGHTHGGQICLPGGIPLLRHDSLPMKFFLGCHRMGRTCLVVNRGFGFSTAGVRLFCPAEVVEVRLVRG